MIINDILGTQSLFNVIYSYKAVTVLRNRLRKNELNPLFSKVIHYTTLSKNIKSILSTFIVRMYHVIDHLLIMGIYTSVIFR